MAQPTELILLVGDLHIPMKSSTIPDLFQDLLIPNRFSSVLCTGNIGSSTKILDYLKSLGKSLHIVKGEYEDSQAQIPENKLITVGKFRIAIVHGHQVIPWGEEESLLNYLRENEPDVIISGHTHELKGSKYEGKLFINPGSFTGAYGPLNLDVDPSFVVLEINDKSLEAFFYRIEKKEVIVNKMSYIKGEKLK